MNTTRRGFAKTIAGLTACLMLTVRRKAVASTVEYDQKQGMFFTRVIYRGEVFKLPLPAKYPHSDPSTPPEITAELEGRAQLVRSRFVEHEELMRIVNPYSSRQWFFENRAKSKA